MAENKVENFFKNEYRKLVHFVQKNMEKRYADVSPEDIVQDVALNMLDKLHIDAQIENLAAYIYRSLRNKIVDEQKKKRINVYIDEFVDKKRENSINIRVSEEDENVVELNNYQPYQLFEAMEQLSDEDKYIIKTNHFEGKSFQQLSEELNTPIGTLLSRKHRAQAKLGKILAAYRIN